MKANLFYFILAGFVLFSCSSPKREAEAINGVLYADQYMPPAFAEANRLEKMKAAFPVVDKIFRDQFEKSHFPGLAYGIVVGGHLVHSNAFGFSNVSSKSSVTSQTGFRIASMTKSFTALSILKLRDEGKLGLEDLASKYIPEMGKVRYLTQDSQPITIKHLLTMSAGFPEDNPWGDRQLADTDEELLQLINEGISYANAPGLVFEYSNLGFAMLGKIVSTVSGKPYQQYITENILLPLKMNETRWEFTQVPKEKLALGYRWEQEQWKEEPILHDGSFGAMGGLICSVEDFSKYLQFHISAWPPRNDEESPILKRSSLREMHQLQRLGGFFPNAKNRSGETCPTISGYGFGLGFRKDCSGTVSIRHGGGLPGYGSEWRFFPELGIGIVSLSNLTYGGLGLQNAIALDTLVYMAGLQPRMLPASVILQQRQKEIMELLPNWSKDKLSILAENFFLDQSLDSWKITSAKILEECGKIKNVNSMVPENQLRGTFIIEGEKKNIEVFFTLTPEQIPLIQQLDLTIQAKK